MSNQPIQCPFCKEASMEWGALEVCVDRGSAYVECGRCGAHGPVVRTSSKDAAVAAWNSRKEIQGRGAIEYIALENALTSLRVPTEECARYLAYGIGGADKIGALCKAARAAVAALPPQKSPKHKREKTR